ncbi:MAG: CapA family protein [Saprospiraceae bacterium]
MIVLGDIACPTKELNQNLVDVFSKTPLFTGKSLVCNLEGLICNEEIQHDGKPVLYNHSRVIKTLVDAGVKAVSLANNHTLDLTRQFNFSSSELSKNNIAYNGAGKSPEEAAKPITFIDNGQEVIVLSACWNFLLYHQHNPQDGVFIHTIDENKLLGKVSKIRENNPSAKILVFLHWSFDLETLPFPMYRQWSMALIDEGVDFVVGCHSHCVQGGEKYKEGYIVYGLGNFYIPNWVFAGGALHFPEFSKLQLAFEFDFEKVQAFCHWFNYNDDHTLTFLNSEKFEDSEMLKKYSPFQKMTEKDYIAYYKSHRRKKMFVPVYKNFKDIRTNFFYTFYLKKRAKFARFLAKKKVIKWQN